MSWSQLADWWRSEIRSDPAYESVVTPLLIEILDAEPRNLYLDIGCGEGRMMRALETDGARVHGADPSFDLVGSLPNAVVADALRLPFASDSFDGAYCVLTLEHIEDHIRFYAEAARVTKTEGVLALVINHPTWTAPASTPITDGDGEVLWRPGDYFSTGTTEVLAGDSSVTFFHRSMADLLNAASKSGWRLEQMIEQPHHEFENQSGIPRLLACRWRLA